MTASTFARRQSGALGLTAAEPDSDSDSVATTGAAAANLSFFALALGIAGAVLGVTVVWFFAAIPLGIAAVVTGGLALRRPQIGSHRARAVLGTVLGLVAVLLGILSAILLPMVVRGADRALTNVRDDVFTQIDRVDRSLANDVDRLDATINREMRNLERQNHQELTRFEKTSAADLGRLERRIAAAEKNLPLQKGDLGRMAQQLRVELAALDTALRHTDTSTLATIDAIAARVHALEVKLALAAPHAPTAAPVEPVQTAAR